MTQPIPVHGLVLSPLQKAGLYTRPIERKRINGNEVMWDSLSEAVMSTQHANARFLVPHLAKTGWALFCDGDMLFRDNVGRVFDALDPSKAIYCVKHNHVPKNATKMDGQVQTKYNRKNWTSFMFFNCDHPANKALTLELINSAPGRDLHRLCWIEDDDLIGELPVQWNWLVGHSDPNLEPKCVHFTDGVPDMKGYEDVRFADEWRSALEKWANPLDEIPPV
jgi:hypothetical protein